MAKNPKYYILELSNRSWICIMPVEPYSIWKRFLAGMAMLLAIVYGLEEILKQD